VLGVRASPHGARAAMSLLAVVSQHLLAAGRARETAATLDRLHAENTGLRRRLAELDPLVA
jgi:hypothetical protein